MAEHYRKGDRIRVDAPLGNGDEDGETLAAKGATGRVVSVNPEFNSEVMGERAVAVELDDGTIAAVPKRAISRDSGKRSFFLPRG